MNQAEAAQKIRTELEKSLSNGKKINIENFAKLLDYGMFKIGLDLNGIDWDRKSILMKAVIGEGDNTQVVKLLIERGANIDQVDRYGKSALIYAAQKDKTEIVKLLIARGANIEHLDAKRKTVLMHAAGEGQIEIVKFLIESGANIHHVDRDGKTMLMHAVQRNQTEIVKLLITHVNNLCIRKKKNGDNELIDSTGLQY